MDFARTAEGLYWRAKQALQEAFSKEKGKGAEVATPKEVGTKAVDSAEACIQIAQFHRFTAMEFRNIAAAMLAKAQEYEDKATEAMEQFAKARTADES